MLIGCPPGNPQNNRLAYQATRSRFTHACCNYTNILDLYSATQRKSSIRQASEELFTGEDLVKHDLGRLLQLPEQQQEQLIRARLTVSTPPEVKLSQAEQREALELLEDPRLMERLLEDYRRWGLVGEEANKQICYLACVSRKLARPLAVLVQSSSAAGKTSLVDATLALMPPEEQLCYSAMTGQSLYYMGQQNLRHKILAIAEEQGVAEASYALKLL